MKLAYTLVAALLAAGPAVAEPDRFLKLLHLLEYVAVDYAAAVSDGEVIDAHEYEEMQEFVEEIGALADKLPPAPMRDAVVTGIAAFSDEVDNREDPKRVASSARALRVQIMDGYKIRTDAPPRNPALGLKLYAQQCVVCHGADGRGDGPAAVGLVPPATNFHDPERMAGRTVFSLYSAITLGIEGTAMVGYAHLSEDERWALAQHVADYLGPARVP